MPGIDLDFAPDPDWTRLARTLRREGEADRVPFFELTISVSACEAVLGRKRPEGSEGNETAEWAAFRTDLYHKAGYDFVGVGSLFHFPRKKRSGGSGASSSTTAAGTISDRANFEQYEWPEVRDEHMRYIEEVTRILPEGMKVRPRGPGGVLAGTVGLMGFEGLSYAIADDEELVEEVTSAVGSRLVELFGRYAQHESVDFITMGDDMGFRTATMISPDHLRRFIFPWHRRIAEAIHAQGKIAVLHSDGNLKAVMDDVIDCGWDAKHSVEDAIITAPEMKKAWGDRIAICGAIDMDRLERDPADEVRSHTRSLIEACAPGGGWCLGSGNAITEYVPIENYVALLESGWEFGRYSA